jgi:flagellar basal-body rod protein FlgB
MDLQGTEGRLLLQLMSAATLRGRVISNNIAQANTPGFKRQVVRFEDLVARELQRTGRADGVTPTITTDLDTPARPDGNNVTLELEMNAGSENRLLYETYATILSGRMEMIRSAIMEDR